LFRFVVFHIPIYGLSSGGLNGVDGASAVVIVLRRIAPAGQNRIVLIRGSAGGEINPM
jgi:hypothetical protein